MSTKVEITIDPQVSTPINEVLLRRAAIIATQSRGFTTGEIGVRVTDDATIRSLNVKHLDHDYATDVISFGYAANPPMIEGEMVVSADTARRCAAEVGWSMDLELCLYVVHGSLHITGMDDQDPQSIAEMRAAETQVMKSLGFDEVQRCGVDSNGSNSQQERLA